MVLIKAVTTKGIEWSTVIGFCVWCELHLWL